MVLHIRRHYLVRFSRNFIFTKLSQCRHNYKLSNLFRIFFCHLISISDCLNSSRSIFLHTLTLPRLYLNWLPSFTRNLDLAGMDGYNILHTFVAPLRLPYTVTVLMSWCVPKFCRTHYSPEKSIHYIT